MARRRKANLRGRAAEGLAAVFLIGRGYRIVARRYKTPVGEIDLIMRRGKRIAFVEVKRRPTRLDCEAAVTAETRRRVRRAADWWLAHNPKSQTLDVGFDLIFVMPWTLPVYLPDAL